MNFESDIFGPYTGEQDVLRWGISHFLEVSCISLHPDGIGTELLEGKLAA